MSSPVKRGKRPIYGGPPGGLSEPALPLHLALAWLIIKTFPQDGHQPVGSIFSATFISAILHIAAREIFELGDAPVSYESLLKETDTLVRRETARLRKANEKIRVRGQTVSDIAEGLERVDTFLADLPVHFATVPDGCSLLDTLEKEVRDRMNQDDEADLTEIPEPFERRSPVGIFLRKLLVTLRKLSFEETAFLSREIGQWCGTIRDEPSRGFRMWSLDRKTAMEETLDKRMTAIQDYQASTSAGDQSASLAALRRFYDYQFPSAGRGQHQHALLNLATAHYSTGGLESATSAVEEAIRVARAEGDQTCLRQCMSLMHRLTTETACPAVSPGESLRVQQSALPSSRLPKSASPMDELWSTGSALDMGEPVHFAFRRIHLALARHEHTSVQPEDKRDTKDGWATQHEFDVAAWHATQAGLWTLLGSDTLASIHEDMALADTASNSDARLTVNLCRAERSLQMQRHGKYEEALAILFEQDTIFGLTIHHYQRWASAVWAMISERSSMLEDDELDAIVSGLRSFIAGSNSAPRGSMQSFGLNDSPSRSEQGPRFADGIRLVQEEVRVELRKARKLQDARSPPQLTLPHVLAAMHLSSGLGLWATYRYSVIVLGEVLLAMEGVSMASRVLEEVGRVWDQVLATQDEEAIARGSLVLGKATLDMALDSAPVGDLAVPAEHLRRCLRSAENLRHRSMITQATSLLALVADLQELPERDALADQWKAARSGDDPLLSSEREQVRQMGEIVKLVGVRVAEGWK